MNDERFDQLVNELRDEPVSPEQAASAAERVWKKLQIPPACAGFREDFPAYVAGTLTESRRLLVDDHLGRCSQCRTALAEHKGDVVSIVRPRRRAAAQWPRWAAAAGVALAALYLGSDRIDAALAPSGPRATIVAVKGDVYRWPEGALRAGAEIGEGESIQTASGARAILRLADGSQVEMNQRTELSIQARWSGQTLHLGRGDVMVEAAKQRRGHLRVQTHDSTVAVKGTTFEVSSGTAGSLVAVVEGSVAVEQGGQNKMLSKGQTSVSNPALQQPTREAVAWSQEAEKYYTVLGELAGIEKQLAANTIPRTEPRMLRYLPEGVQVYIAVPNLGGSLSQAMFQIDQRARENAVLNQWWTSREGAELRKHLDQLQQITPMLGEELVFALVREPGTAHNSYPLILTSLQSGREGALKQFLDGTAGGPQNQVNYRIAGGLVTISDSDAHLTSSTRPGSQQFAAEIAKRYQGGAGWLAAVDMTAMPTDFRQSAEGRAVGLGNLRYVFFEQSTGGRAEDNRASMMFAGARSGIASWLAPAGSAGSTEYVSPEAVAVFSASTKDPRQAFEELLSILGQNESADLRKFESETGVSISADIAGSLGTDFTMAVERPSIPIPGVVAAFEVIRPGVLDATIHRLADSFNQHDTAGQHQVTWKQETVGGRTWTSLAGAGGFITLHWTYDRGYLIAALDRALAARAITIRDAGTSLVHSAAFRDRFPAGSSLHQSGFVWINAAATGLAGLVTNPALKNLLGSREPILVILDGGMEQIQAASRTRLTSMILDTILVAHPIAAEPPSAGQAERVREKQLIAR